MGNNSIDNPMRLFDTREYYFMWFGACRLALSLVDLIGDMQNDRKINNTKFIKNMLNFLLKSKSDMLTYILNSGEGGLSFMVAPVRSPKGKAAKEWKPYRMAYANGADAEISGTEFISEEEHKWRDTARVFANALDNASNAISLMTGRDPGEVFNSLICGKCVERPPGNDDKAPVITDLKLGKAKISKSDIPIAEEPHSSTILDFFAGSSTTAHAVMELNAEDGGGNRKFIMVQLPEPCDEKSEAYKAGYKNIAEIGKERIRRAAKKIAAEHPEAHFDGGFQVFKIDETKSGEAPFAPRTGVIGKQEIFSTILRRAGLPDDTPLTELEICGSRFWSANGGKLIFADEAGTTIEQAEAIIALKPEQISLIKADDNVSAVIGKYLKEHEKLRVKSVDKGGDDNG